jgi:aspartate/methionine/tyrosine aminotransferase
LTVDGELEKAITPKTKMVWIETPTNPTLKIVDIAKIAEVTKARGLLLVVDNTFMTPVFQVFVCVLVILAVSQLNRVGGFRWAAPSGVGCGHLFEQHHEVHQWPQ